MRDMQKMIAERVTDQIAETDPELNVIETARVATDFMEHYFDSRKLGSFYGASPEEALRHQVEQYLEDKFGIEPEARGA